MSKLTQNLLKAVDYDRAKKKREENYRILGELLPSESIFHQTVPEGPFAYPYFHADGMKLRRYLAEKKIFVPTYWKNIIENSETKKSGIYLGCQYSSVALRSALQCGGYEIYGFGCQRM